MGTGDRGDAANGVGLGPFLDLVRSRRSTRHFSTGPAPAKTRLPLEGRVHRDRW
jgi:hypothetical protein